MNSKKTLILIIFLFISLVSFACTIFVGGPAYPANSIPVSTESAGSVEDQFHAAQTEAAQTGTLSLSVNESQITSLLAAKLSDRPDMFIQEPQVYLRDGQIQVYGKATQGNLQANVRIVLTATLDAEGKPVVSVKSADFGPFPAPQGINDSISAFFDQAFTGSFGPAATGLRLESINISDGMMTFTGRVK